MFSSHNHKKYNRINLNKILLLGGKRRWKSGTYSVYFIMGKQIFQLEITMMTMNHWFKILKGFLINTAWVIIYSLLYNISKFSILFELYIEKKIFMYICHGVFVCAAGIGICIPARIHSHVLQRQKSCTNTK